MKIKVFAELDSLHLYGEGIKAGLDEKAANYFRYFTEVELELHVDAENGAVCGCKVLTDFL